MSFFFMHPSEDDYPTLQTEISALYGAAAYDTLSHYTDFIDRFVDIIEDPTSVSAAMRNYLLTEGGDEALDGLPLGATHMLYWLDLQIKAKLRDEHELYVDRLSEATGWGDVAPTTLTGADPLGLVATLEALSVRVAIIDYDAVDDTTSNSRDGVVRITRDTQSCTTIGLTPKNYNDGGGASASLRTSTQTYRYRFWKTCVDLHEDNGSQDSHFPLADVEAIVLIRNTASDHVVNTENQIGVANTQVQSRKITIRGYPGEWPELHCGCSTDSDVTPTTVAGGSSTPWAWYISPAANFYRDNVHFRNIWFHGKRTTAGGKFIFTERILSYSSIGSGHSVRHCQFTDCQPMRPDESPATPAGYVDFAFTARGGDSSFSAVYCTSTDFVFDSNYVQPAGDDFPLPLDSETGVLGFTMTYNGTNQRVTRNRIEGRGLRSPIRCLGTTGIRVSDNYIDSANYKYIFVTDESVDTIIERNFCIRNGTITGQTGEGIDCGEGSTNSIVRHNVTWTAEPLTGTAAGISVSEDTGETTRITDGIAVYGNIVYGTGVVVGYGGAWEDADALRDQFRNVVVENNVIHGFPAVATANVTDAPVRVKLFATPSPSHVGTGSMQTSLGNAIRSNNITRDSGTTAIRVRTTQSTADGYTATATTLDGYSGNTATAPTFADASTGDLRITNSGPWDDWLPASMPFNASLSKAWQPD